MVSWEGGTVPPAITVSEGDGELSWSWTGLMLRFTWDLLRDGIDVTVYLVCKIDL